jgi:antitoxin (DNA-binding transcriptional repressor) of toxin-antitoxin stability system
MPRYVDAKEFEATCLELIDEISKTGDYVVVTRDGQPYVELVRHQPSDDPSKTEAKP